MGYGGDRRMREGVRRKYKEKTIELLLSKAMMKFEK